PLPWWAGAKPAQTLRRDFDVGGADYARVQAFAQALGVQEKSIFLAAHATLLSLLAGQRDVVTSVVTHCRPERDGAEQALGLFLNSLPMRFDLAATSWHELVRGVERTQLDDGAFRH